MSAPRRPDGAPGFVLGLDFAGGGLRRCVLARNAPDSPRHRTARPLGSCLLAGLLLVGACGDDGGSTGAGGDTDGDKAGTGTISLHLEDLGGAVMIEGFEIGLRFTAGGEVVDALLWSDYVESLGAGTIESFYDSVLEQAVPAGTVTIEADVRQSIGGPIEPPDLNGEFPCSLDVEVAEGETVEVEVAFTAEQGCITRAPG